MSKLVMIVDDSLVVRLILEITLRREGISSVSYNDALEALRALNEQRHPIPDLIIVDIGLPKMDGFEFARRLRTKSQYASIPILMLSGRDRIIDRMKGFLAGANDYLSKPFKTREIMSIVQTRLHLIDA